MAIPVQQFGGASGLEWLQGIGAGQGIVNNLFNAPLQRQQLQQQLAAQKLEDQIKQIQLQYAPQTMEATLAGKIAETELNKAKQPYYTSRAEEAAANVPLIKTKTGLMPVQTDISALSALAKHAQNTTGRYSPGRTMIYAANNPLVQAMLEKSPELRKAFAENVSNIATAAAAPYNQSVAPSLMNRTPQQAQNAQEVPSIEGAAPNLGAQLAQAGSQPQSTQALMHQQLQNAIAKQLYPGTAQQQVLSEIAPDMLDTLKSTAGLEKLKKVVPPQVLDKLRYATNVEKTVKMIDFPAITEFSGLRGHALLRENQAKSVDPKTLGKPSPEYNKYLDFVQVQLPRLAAQVRQFYGESIQPTSVKDLLDQINPNRLINNPEQALNIARSLQDILSSEINTYREAAVSPDVYYGKGPGTQLHFNQTFSAPADFTSYWSTLSPEAKAAYKAQISKQEGVKK